MHEMQAGGGHKLLSTVIGNPYPPSVADLRYVSRFRLIHFDYRCQEYHGKILFQIFGNPGVDQYQFWDSLCREWPRFLAGEVDAQDGRRKESGMAKFAEGARIRRSRNWPTGT